MESKKQMLLSKYVKNDLETNKKYSIVNTTDEYAKKLGISRTILYEILSGKHNAPQPFFAVRLCKIFDLDPDEILEMITNVDNDYIDKFSKIYNGDSFEDSCKSTIQYFYDRNDYYYLFDNEPINSEDCDKENYSFSDLKFINIKEETKYIPGICNASCKYTDFDIDNIIDGDEPGMEDNTGYYTSKVLSEYDFDIYYLPYRRVRKYNSKTYLDEEYRDFSNKLLYLLTNENVSYNNIFLTTSKDLYDKIVDDIGNIKVKPNNGVGIALVYCRHNRQQEVFTILENDDMIQGPVFGY